MPLKIYTRTGDGGKTSLIGGTKVPKNHLRIESYGTVDELNSFIGLLADQLVGLPSNSAESRSRGSRDNPSSEPGKNISPKPGEEPLSKSAKGRSRGSRDDASPEPGKDLSSESPERLSPEPERSLSPKPAEDLPPKPADLTVQLREIQDRLFTIGSSLATDPEKTVKMTIPRLEQNDLLLLEQAIDRMQEVLPPLKAFILPGGHPVVSTAHVARCVCRRAERLCVGMQEQEMPVEPIIIGYLNRLSDYLFVVARYSALLLGVEEIVWKPGTGNSPSGRGSDDK